MALFEIKFRKTVRSIADITAKDENEAREKFKRAEFDGEEQDVDVIDMEVVSVKESK